MSWPEVVGIVVAGLGAGAINAIVGSGTLITFPVLLVFGYSPVVANVSNTVGLVGAGATSIHGYRAEIRGYGAVIRRLLPASFAGAVVGAILLLSLPSSAFDAIVPVLIAIALVLVLVGPTVQRRAAVRGAPARSYLVLLAVGVFLAGVYGGYFGAAQGVLLIGLMSTLMTADLQEINGIKNVLGTVVNAVAALMFIAFAWDKVDWAVVGLIAIGGLVGGYVGARVGRRLPPIILRSIIVVIAVVAIVKLLS